MRRSSRHLAALALTAIVPALSFDNAAPGAPMSDAAESAVRRLRLATTPTRDNAHIRTMFSLRQLRDPELRPLFRRLALVDDWQMQVHAVLGLAEVADPPAIDVALVRDVPSPGQEHLIVNALDEGFLTLDQMETLLHDPAVQPLPRLLLLAELSRSGRSTDTTMLHTLNQHADLRVAGLAACLLARTHGQEALSDYRHRLAALGRRERAQHHVWIFEIIGAYELAAALPLVHDALGEANVPRATVHAGLGALLRIDSVQGEAVWRRLLGSDPTHSERVRFGMMLLEAGASVAPDTFEHIRNDEPLTAAIIDVGVAMARGRDQSPAAIALLDCGHLASTEWIMEHARTLPPSQAVPIYEHLVNNLVNVEGPQNDRTTLAMRAIERLFAIDPQRIVDHLESVDDDSLIQQVLLLGLFETNDPMAGHAAARIPRHGPGRADSIALVLLARHSDGLAPTDLEQLGVIARGGGRVSEMLQTQAAWLYLKHTGAMDAALNRLCAVDPASDGPSP